MDIKFAANIVFVVFSVTLPHGTDSQLYRRVRWCGSSDR